LFYLLLALAASKTNEFLNVAVCVYVVDLTDSNHGVDHLHRYAKDRRSITGGKSRHIFVTASALDRVLQSSRPEYRDGVPFDGYGCPSYFAGHIFAFMFGRLFC
jgi:hypothetical protein